MHMCARTGGLVGSSRVSTCLCTCFTRSLVSFFYWSVVILQSVGYWESMVAVLMTAQVLKESGSIMSCWSTLDVIFLVLKIPEYW